MAALQKAKKILRAARELLTPPGNWCRLTFARDVMGRTVLPTSPYAACWCAVGAMVKVEPLDDRARELAGGLLRDRVRARIGSNRVSEFNDTRTHAEVLALFDDVIKGIHDEELPIRPASGGETQRGG